MKKLILFLMSIGLVASLNAADKVDERSGASRNYQVSRWTLTKAGAEANTDTQTVGSLINADFALALTSSISTKPGVVRKVFFVPGAATDTFRLVNAANSTSDLSKKIFETVPNTPTMANSPTNPFNANQALVYDFGEGLPYTTALTCFITRAASTTASRAYIMHDGTR